MKELKDSRSGIHRWKFAIIAAIIVAGAFLRFCQIGNQNLWLDEMTSIQVAGEPIGSIVTGRAFDNHTPPLYYVMLHYLAHVIPLDETGVRIPSAIIDVINMVLLTVLCSRFLPLGNLLVVLSVYALSPFMLYYSQEGRMYTLAVLFAISLAIAMERLIFSDGHEKTWAAISGIIFALGLYTHYFMFFFAFGAVSLALFLGARSPGKSKYILFSCLIAAVLYAYWFPVVYGLSKTAGQSFRQFNFIVLPYTFFRFVVGYGIFPLNMVTRDQIIPAIVDHLPVISMAFVAILIPILGYFRFNYPRGRSFAGSAAWIISVPIVVGMLLSIRKPMLSERYLIIIYPFFIMMLFGSIDFKNKWQGLGIGLFLVLNLIGVLAYFFNPHFGKTQWRDVAKHVNSITRPGDVILIEPDYVGGVFDYYYKDSSNTYLLAIQKLENNSAAAQKDLYDTVKKYNRIIFLKAGADPEGEYAGVLKAFATRKSSVVYPLETGIKCEIWEFK